MNFLINSRVLLMICKIDISWAQTFLLKLFKMTSINDQKAIHKNESEENLESQIIGKQYRWLLYSV